MGATRTAWPVMSSAILLKRRKIPFFAKVPSIGIGFFDRLIEHDSSCRKKAPIGSVMAGSEGYVIGNDKPITGADGGVLLGVRKGVCHSLSFSSLRDHGELYPVFSRAFLACSFLPLVFFACGITDRPNRKSINGCIFGHG